jgi:cysteine-rich repeat protein
VLEDGARFGASLAALGDLDGDGVVDLAVGSPGDSDVGDSTDARRGAIWILFLARDLTVKSAQKIDTQQGGFQGPLSEGDELGRALAGVGDMDGDSIVDLAAGAPGDDTGGRDRGAVWLLFLERDGSVKSARKIAAGRGGFAGNVENRDRFGAALASLGDVDGDGAIDLAVGAPFDDDGGWRLSSDFGAVWLLFLDSHGAVKDHRKISATSGDLPGSLGAAYRFGASVAAIGDVDGDGGLELAIGAPGDREDYDYPRYSTGAVWIVSLPPTTLATCGDGVTVGMEQCDDGDTVTRDGCDGQCRVEAGFTCTGTPSHCELTCSDGVIAPQEECDDGNRTDGDGCDARCRVESEFFCKNQPSQCYPVTTTTTTTGGTTTSISYWFSTTTTPDPLGVCGDGIFDDVYEGCDDGNLEADDGCSPFCYREDGWRCTSETEHGTSSCIRVCGDGVKLPCLSEECDDGNLIDGDGCNRVCDVEPGFACTNGPTVCYRCGDGQVDPVEQCDQGSGDSPGCDATCFVAPGWACEGEPSVCTYLCGNGVRDEGEECDDTGLTGGDGCSPACTIEPDWRCIGSPSTCTPRGSVTTTTTTLPPACGDANGDRRVTSSDALQALLAAIGLANCAPELCDADGSGGVSAVDALAILRDAVGLPTQLNCA